MLISFPPPGSGLCVSDGYCRTNESALRSLRGARIKYPRALIVNTFSSADIKNKAVTNSSCVIYASRVLTQQLVCDGTNLVSVVTFLAAGVFQSSCVIGSVTDSAADDVWSFWNDLNRVIN
jgi:hypothetical protein